MVGACPIFYRTCYLDQAVAINVDDADVIGGLKSMIRRFVRFLDEVAT